MLRFPGSLPIGGRELEPPPPPPLLLPDPQPPSMAAPPSDAAPARNDRRSSLLVMEPPMKRITAQGGTNLTIMSAGVQTERSQTGTMRPMAYAIRAPLAALAAAVLVAAGCGSGASAAARPAPPALPQSALPGMD